MVVLSVLGGLLLLLVGACIWEARTGRPQWGSRTRPNEPLGTAAASRAAKGAIASSVVIAAMDAGGDG